MFRMKGRGRNDCRDMRVGHVSNVPGTMQWCPTVGISLGEMQLRLAERDDYDVPVGEVSRPVT